ncbi:MAG: UrcA family protein [Acidobacteriaceae bacterium]|nr:UrcA family protein [Acidobacteriaceae bacterium]
MNTTLSNRSLTACAVIVLPIWASTGEAASPAIGENYDNVRRQVVRFADLNLSVAPGAERLYARIRSAAIRVCGPEDGRNLVLGSGARACVQKAIADAVADVGSAELCAIHEAHQGHTQSAQAAKLAQR